jgi:hypothetical protein
LLGVHAEYVVADASLRVGVLASPRSLGQV